MIMEILIECYLYSRYNEWRNNILADGICQNVYEKRKQKNSRTQKSER